MLKLFAAAIDARRAFCAIKPSQVFAALFRSKILETDKLTAKCKIDSICRSVSLFRDDQFGDVSVGLSAIVLLFTIDKRDHVGVLLNGARFSQVGELWPVVSAIFGRTRQLGQRHHWNV